MSERPSRVLFVLANGGRGGMQSQVALVASGLCQRGVEVSVAVGGGGFGPIEGVRAVELPPFDSRAPWRFLRALRAEVRHSRPDVVHGHGLRLGPLLGFCRAPQRFVTCHGIDPRRINNALRALRLTRARIVACGEGPRALMAAHGVASVVIDNALAERATPATSEELRREFDLIDAVPVVVLPARFSEQKNHEALLSSLRAVRSRLRERSPEVVAIGDGPLFTATVDAATVAGDRPLMHCHPYRNDASRWLGASDFFVLSSLWEGQPQVVLEALAADLAVLTSTPIGVEDLVSDGRNGRRVATVAELADVMVQWCEQPTTRPVDPAFNASLIERHRLDSVVERYLSLYGLAGAPA